MMKITYDAQTRETTIEEVADIEMPPITYQPTLEERNRSDIDYILIMEGL